MHWFCWLGGVPDHGKANRAVDTIERSRADANLISGVRGSCDTELKARSGMNVAIDIPDEVVRALTAKGVDLSRAVLEAVASAAYRSGAITPAQVLEMLDLRSRWAVESFLHDADAYHEYTMDDLDRDIAAIRSARRQ
ncbi:MAG: UPF0175 family protein [Bryobacteraceae bacterium]